MSSPSHRGSRIFLIVGGIGNLLVYGFPFLLFPEKWAEIFQWEGQVSTEFGLYMARSLGAVSVAFSAGAFWAARDPAGNRIVFKMTALICALLAVLHVYGAFLENWPWTETLEIVTWGGLAALTLYFMPRVTPDAG